MKIKNTNPYNFKFWHYYASEFKVFISLLMIILAGNSCERIEPSKTNTVDCAECFQEKPEWLPLNIKVSITSENPFVPITVFKGNLEENNIDWVDTAYQEDYYVDVHPDEYYSVEAKYKSGTKTIIAVDGDKIKARYTSSDCDESCYYKSGGYIDVRLLK